MHADYTGLIGTFGVVLARFRETWKRKGFLQAIRMICTLCVQVLMTPVYTQTMGRKTFRFQQKNLQYFCHWYNTTFLNERAVEVAVALDMLQATKGKDVLEVGNVLSHYTNLPRDVVDKYEKGPNVINEDIVDFHPTKRYDLIISLSTLEHVGFDEQPKDPTKFVKAVKHLQTLLKPDGKMFVTIPVGYNDNAVRDVTTGHLFSELLYFSHESQYTWKEVSKDEALTRQFFSPYQFANAVIFCLY